MIGGRVAFSLKESKCAYIGTVTKIYPGGSLLVQVDDRTEPMVFYPGVDNVKPVYKWNKIKGAQQ